MEGSKRSYRMGSSTLQRLGEPGEGERTVDILYRRYDLRLHLIHVSPIRRRLGSSFFKVSRIIIKGTFNEKPGSLLSSTGRVKRQHPRQECGLPVNLHRAPNAWYEASFSVVSREVRVSAIIDSTCRCAEVFSSVHRRLAARA